MRDSLSEMNDHLGRFLRQADELLDDWTRFGAEVRARVDGEVGRLGDTIADAVDAQVERGTRRVTDMVRELKVERSHTRSIAIAALVFAVLANVMLLLLLFRSPAPAPAPAPAPLVMAP